MIVPECSFRFSDDQICLHGVVERPEELVDQMPGLEGIFSNPRGGANPRKPSWNKPVRDNCGIGRLGVVKRQNCNYEQLSTVNMTILLQFFWY